MPEQRPIPPRPALPADARGIIGNMKTTALVSLRGSIDFMCFPRIDSPTIFAGLLEPSRGGAFSIEPVSDTANVKQMYLPDTNVLLTRFMTAEGVCELVDFMPVPADGDGAERDVELPNCVIRVVRMVYGQMKLKVRCAPRGCPWRRLCALPEAAALPHRPSQRYNPWQRSVATMPAIDPNSSLGFCRRILIHG